MEKLKYPLLFSPITVNGKVFKNRILSAPIGDWVFSPENYIFDYGIDFFGERAAGGCASVLVGHTEVNTGTEFEESFGLYFNLCREPQGSAALAEFANAVRRHGAHVGVQINHSGANINGRPGQTYYAPSAAPARSEGVTIEEMPKEHIRYTIDRFVRCALRLKKAGFDMLMLHGGHGWLLQQFFSPETNRRTDEYGGSLENRCRFGVELVSAIREAVGPDFIIEYRISGIDPADDPQGFEELVTYLGKLEGMIDIVNVSSGVAGTNDAEKASHTFPSYLHKRGVNLALSAPLKQRIRTAVAVVGNISDPDFAEQVLADGKADFVSMARALTADPEFPKKARCGRAEDIRPCIGCYNCLEIMHGNHFYGCDVNPRVGREHSVAKVVKTLAPQKVVVIGGGVAGMEAALTADEMGHKVVLFEKSDALGGLLKLSDGDSVKYLLNRLKTYYVDRMARSAVDVRLNTEATVERIEAEEPDAIFLATGSVPIVPDIPGVHGKNVFTCLTAHEPGADLGQKVVIVGGNMVGCETALSLKARGKDVTVVEMTDRLYSDATDILGMSFAVKMRGIEQRTGTRCVEITDRGIVAEHGGQREIIEADSVLLAVGLRPVRDLAPSLSGYAGTYAELGDCVKPANVRQATRHGFYAARDLV